MAGSRFLYPHCPGKSLAALAVSVLPPSPPVCCGPVARMPGVTSFYRNAPLYEPRACFSPRHRGRPMGGRYRFFGKIHIRYHTYVKNNG